MNNNLPLGGFPSQTNKALHWFIRQARANKKTIKNPERRWCIMKNGGKKRVATWRICSPLVELYYYHIHDEWGVCLSFRDVRGLVRCPSSSSSREETLKTNYWRRLEEKMFHLSKSMVSFISLNLNPNNSEVFL